MSGARRAPITALARLLQQQHPELSDPVASIVEGRVLVDGRTITNPQARVPRSARIRVLPTRRLRGDEKLSAGLDALGVPVDGAIAVDVGAAAGGFTDALLRHGARRVYAVDAGHGQLAGRLRTDPRVVDLERTNLADLDGRLVPDGIDVVTMDLSYLAIADAAAQLDRLRYERGARLVALVKPTFELHAASLVTDAAQVRRAIEAALAGVIAAGWRPVACTLPRVTGAGGAIESFVLAVRP